MTRLQIAAGNWKMNKTFEDAMQLSRALANATRDENVLTIMATPSIYLKMIVDQVLHVPGLEVAAQNCHEKESGAYTGEISAPMLESIGVKYVIIGHSERREYFAESNEVLARKVDIALANNLIPIFCCGESLEIRKSGKHLSYVANQLKESLYHLSAEELSKVIVAYEPIWAIGTGETASPEQAQEMHEYLRNALAEQYSEDIANGISILYGGSVKPANAQIIFSQKDVDGGLVGGASLKAEDFVQIINAF
ncbi:triose-phosphate isomerase [Portibacter lacus]|uniref:Triosephosphate isomerase n=1 Tax=Portibacter lacus TaxID=1099794 RepID=A0AA37SP64_9BACT|nr:triose-phosphate isomerase [Portibacter lacus]GLR16326.1 triosephosphate isomerase [Portibacter lacus]